jgi:hypothetical protein
MKTNTKRRAFSGKSQCSGSATNPSALALCERALKRLGGGTFDDVWFAKKDISRAIEIIRQND